MKYTPSYIAADAVLFPTVIRPEGPMINGAPLRAAGPITITCSDFKIHEDEGQWRSYDLEAEGETLAELLESAVYWQTDQDGGSLGEVPADDDKAIKYITEQFNRRVANARL